MLLIALLTGALPFTSGWVMWTMIALNGAAVVTLLAVLDSYRRCAGCAAKRPGPT